MGLACIDEALRRIRRGEMVRDGGADQCLVACANVPIVGIGVYRLVAMMVPGHFDGGTDARSAKNRICIAAYS